MKYKIPDYLWAACPYLPIGVIVGMPNFTFLFFVIDPIEWTHPRYGHQN